MRLVGVKERRWVLERRLRGRGENSGRSVVSDMLSIEQVSSSRYVVS